MKINVKKVPIPVYPNEKKEYGKKLIRDFIEYCLKHSKKNVELARFSLHTIIGQALKNVYFSLDARREDVRTHLLYFQDTGSGKGALYPEILKFGEDLGLNVRDVVHCTSEALIGTPYYDTKIKEYKISEGILCDCELFCMEEADELFQNMDFEHHKNTFTYIQKACNSIHGTETKGKKIKRPSHIHKKLTMGPPVDLDPVASFMLYSYIPEKFIETVATRGLIPRFITVIRYVSLEEREEVLDAIFDSLNRGITNEYKKEYDSILDRLEVVINRFKNNGKPLQIEFTDSAVDNLRKIGHEMADLIRDASPSAKKTLEGFLTRYVLMIAKVASHRTMLRLETQVELEDTQYSRLVMMPVWCTLMAYLEMNLIPDVTERVIFKGRLFSAVNKFHTLVDEGNKMIITKYSGHVWVRRQSLISEIKTDEAWLDCSENAASEYFKRFEKKERERSPKAWFEARNFGRTPYVRLVRDLVV